MRFADHLCCSCLCRFGSFYLIGKMFEFHLTTQKHCSVAQAVLAAANSLAEAAHVNKELSGELSAVPQKLTQEAVGQLSKAATQGLAKSA
jgi:hypothetical protein